MNSDIELIASGFTGMRPLARARQWTASYEARFSRFRALSELTRLNAADGRLFRASPALYRLVELGLQLARRSNGLFDPTVLPALDAAGYDRSFDCIGPTSSGWPSRLCHSWRDVELDATNRTICMPPGCRIDLGGIGKGWAVDRLAGILGSPSLVNGGGDVYANGRPEPGEKWRIGIADPFDPEHDASVIAVEDCGVATSSTLKRRWFVDGIVAHHLIDPRTGRPSLSDLVQVTAIAPYATGADYHAKVALLLGSEDGIDYLNREPNVEGLAFRADGVALVTAGFARYAIANASTLKRRARAPTFVPGMLLGEP